MSPHDTALSYTVSVYAVNHYCWNFLLLLFTLFLTYVYNIILLPELGKLLYESNILHIKTHGSVLVAKKSRKKKMRAHTGVLFTRPVE